MHLDRNIDGLLCRPPHKPPVKNKDASDPYAKARDPYGRLIWDPSSQRWTTSNGSVDPYGRAIWRPDSPGFIALTRVFDLFYSEIIADGRIPLIVIIPGPLDVENFVNERPKLYEALTDHFKAKQYRWFDFLDPLVAKHKDDLSYDELFVVRHFKGPINKELAGEVIKALGLP
jgi:hypothetical protein